MPAVLLIKNLHVNKDYGIVTDFKPPHLKDVLETSNCDGEVHTKQGKVSKSCKGWQLRVYMTVGRLRMCATGYCSALHGIPSGN